MGELSKIGWTDNTFNPWWGCARVSPACRFCYADSTAQRWGFELWRRHGERRMLSEGYWAKPRKWNRDAERAGRPVKVFCASMADVFEDHPAVAEPRKRLWGLIEETPWLRWQLCTKRPGNVEGMVPWGTSWPSWVWLGISVENQEYAGERIPVLLDLPAEVRFLSCEPLLGPVDLTRYLWLHGGSTAGPFYDHAGRRRGTGGIGGQALTSVPSRDIGWVITGGESGRKARRTEVDWFGSLRDQCAEARVPFFFKQTGHVLARELGIPGKGEEWEDLPAEFRVRQFPPQAQVVPA